MNRTAITSRPSENKAISMYSTLSRSGIESGRLLFERLDGICRLILMRYSPYGCRIGVPHSGLMLLMMCIWLAIWSHEENRKYLLSTYSYILLSDRASRSAFSFLLQIDCS